MTAVVARWTVAVTRTARAGVRLPFSWPSESAPAPTLASKTLPCQVLAKTHPPVPIMEENPVQQVKIPTVPAIQAAVIINSSHPAEEAVN